MRPAVILSGSSDALRVFITAANPRRRSVGDNALFHGFELIIAYNLIGYASIRYRIRKIKDAIIQHSQTDNKCNLLFIGAAKDAVAQ
jgi:hypothetical protein